ncbi:HAD-IC family P-type ATPase [Nitriliruptoraceae bacterium ZYF776]|nr:HAD-IC family P-type ATPase [Profundirhabdus halotolerans]
MATHHLTPEQVCAALEVDPDRGLDTAEVAARRERHGANVLAEAGRRSPFAIVVAQLRSPLIAILLVALAVTVAIEEHADAVVILAVLVLNTVIGAVQEHRADRSVDALLELATPTSVVRRDGRRVEIDARELVPGDVVVLASGDRVPADLRLLRCTELEIDESLLTGESAPAAKHADAVPPATGVADRTGSAHLGTSVTTGRALGVVTAIGPSTELGRIAEGIRSAQRPRTPLQQRMHRFAHVIALVVGVSTVATFLLGLALGQPADAMFLTAVALAVAVVPEGLPVAVTVAMALGVRRMAARRAVVRTLPAVETLGSTDLIGSDKTGTLTQNRMTVRELWTATGHHPLPAATGPGPRPERPEDPLLLDGLVIGVLANEAHVHRDVDGTPSFSGDPTETALLAAATAAGIDVARLRAARPVVAEVPFESARGYACTVVDGPHGRELLVKGAPERVLARCTELATVDGHAPLDRAAALAIAEAVAGRGARVLALARAPWEGADAPKDPTGLSLVGFVAMQDPPRPGVREAIAACGEAGIRVVMITGDHAATARAIADELGIGAGDPTVVTGAELEELSDDALRRMVTEVDVFARATPEHKHRVVRALHAHDLVVAVTGDGVNDGPALKAADIGVAMGRDGTDVAREAADMVLTDDDFVSIVAAVEEGRVVFDNVRKVTYFLLSTGAAAIVAIVTALAAGWPLPYTPAALLWLNVVTNGLQDVALAFERGEPDVLRQPPRSRAEGIVPGELWLRTVFVGATLAAGSLWLFRWAAASGLDASQQRGAALTTLVVAMALHAGNARSARRSIVAVPLRDNPFLVWAVAGAVALHVATSYLAPVQRLLGTAPVTAAGWWRIAVVAAATVLVSELHKAWGRRRTR